MINIQTNNNINQRVSIRKAIKVRINIQEQINRMDNLRQDKTSTDDKTNPTGNQDQISIKHNNISNHKDIIMGINIPVVNLLKLLPLLRTVLRWLQSCWPSCLGIK
jgi:hypothetical protein